MRINTQLQTITSRCIEYTNKELSNKTKYQKGESLNMKL